MYPSQGEWKREGRTVGRHQILIALLLEHRQQIQDVKQQVLVRYRKGLDEIDVRPDGEFLVEGLFG
jgi:hypothetical protein